MKAMAELKEKYENALLEIDNAENVIEEKNIIPTGLLYLSYPIGDANHDSNPEISELAGRFQQEIGTKGTVVSPIHNFIGSSYTEKEDGYWEEISRCLRLLDSCDGIILSGNWRKSLECCIECMYCIEHNIPIYTESDERTYA